MKKILSFALGLMILLSSTVFAEAEKAYIAYYDSTKNIIIVETSWGYSVMDLYSYAWISRGDVVIGNFNQYGYTDIYDATADTSLSVYIDNYMLSADTALDWAANHN